MRQIILYSIHRRCVAVVVVAAAAAVVRVDAADAAIAQRYGEMKQLIRTTQPAMRFPADLEFVWLAVVIASAVCEFHELWCCVVVVRDVWFVASNSMRDRRC